VAKPKRGVFLIHPENADFVRGKAAAPAKSGNTPPPIFIWLVLIPISLITVGLIAWSVIAWNNYQQLSADGQTAQGVIQSKRTYEDDATTDYYLRYGFEVNGQSYTKEAEVSQSRYRATAEGESIAVLYVPANPSISVVADQHRPPALLTLLTGIFVALIFITYGLMANQRQRAARLKQQGKLVRGQILKVREYMDEGDTQYEITYLFEEPGTPNTIEGKTEHPANLLRRKPERGMAVAVYYANRSTHELL
jgi:hypothetical protein